MAIDPITSISETVGGIVKRIWPDPTEELRSQVEAFGIAVESQIAIHETNRAEAQHPSMFVAGWRPFIGWTCGFGLAYQFLAQPMLAWGSGIWEIPVPPALDTGTLTTVLTGMLGLAGMRSFEAFKGTKRSSWGPGKSSNDEAE